MRTGLSARGDFRARHRVSNIAGLQVTSRCHVGGQEQKNFSPLGNELHFDANLTEKFLLF